MKRIGKTAAVLVILFSVTGALPVTTEAAPQSKNDDWSSIPFKRGQKVIYISNDGSDRTGKVYRVGDAVIGDDPRHPPDHVKAFQSLHHDTWTRARGMESPWLMIKRGDKWTIEGGDAFSHNDTTRGVVDYGPVKEARPVVRVSGGHALKIFGQTQPGFVLYGIDFRAFKQRKSGVNALGEIDDILIEDCRFHGFAQGIIAQDRGSQDMNKLRIRRNVIVDSHSGQGIYLHGVNGGLIEQNVIDHNGFVTRNPGSPEFTGSVYNHNLYSAPNVTNLTVRDNIIARASSHGTTLHRKGKIVGNVYIRNPIAILCRTANQEVIGNIVTEGYYITTDKHRAWGIQVGGQSVKQYRGPAVLKNNLVYYKHPDARMVKHKRAIIHGDSPLIKTENNHTWAWGEGSARLPAPITIADYHKAMGGEGSTEAFLEQARTRRRGDWPEASTAAAVQQWVRGRVKSSQ